MICRMHEPAVMVSNLEAPLYRVVGAIAALWVFANLGYYFALPLFGFGLSYNDDPIVIALYFLFWACASTLYFRDLFAAWLTPDRRIWTYGALSLGLAGLAWSLLYALTLLPALHGPALPFSDLLLATPWYFLPKAVEILVQQLLTTALILALHFHFRSFRQVLAGYAFVFGGSHIALYALAGAPVPYAAVMTAVAFASTAVFPYLILRVRGGLVYSYAIHLFFYILFAMLLRTWPPPGYLGA